MKKRIRRFLGLLCVTLLSVHIFISSIVNSEAWNGPNVAYYYEGTGGFYYYFSMYIQPSYNDQGYHYARGYWHVSGGESGDMYYYTPAGTSANDSRILGYSEQPYKDWWDFNHPEPVSTNGGPHAVTIPHGASYWLSISETE